MSEIKERPIDKILSLVRQKRFDKISPQMIIQIASLLDKKEDLNKVKTQRIKENRLKTENLELELNHLKQEREEMITRIEKYPFEAISKTSILNLIKETKPNK